MRYEKATVEVIARGVYVVAGQLLLCYGKGSELTYLPGGHIEFRETGRQALEREILEELGCVAEVGTFLGCCEHAFVQKGVPHTEINLVFEMRIPELIPEHAVTAVETWIGFRWHPLDQLASARLEPSPLQTHLPHWLHQPGGHVVAGDAWETPEL